jgi:hypothetical protein
MELITVLTILLLAMWWAAHRRVEPSAQAMIMSVADVRTLARIARHRPKLNPRQADAVMAAVDRRLAVHQHGQLQLAPDVRLSLEQVVLLLQRVREHAERQKQERIIDVFEVAK